MKLKWFLLLILIIGTAITYDFKCPSQAEWRLNANVSCLAANKYVCLFHVLEQKYQDNCLGPERSSIGSNLVFQPLFNIGECNAGRYQPIVFTTNGNSECILLKSKCDEEGEVVYSNGTSGHDITCRCDYTQGYSFVSKPENNCFCKPSEEDCSCFRVECTKLSPDYECIPDGETIGNTTCQEMQSQISYTVNRHERTVQDIKSDIKRYSYGHHVTYIIFIVIAVYIVIAVLMLQVFVPPKILEQKTIPSDSAKIDIGLESVIMSYLPLTSVKWCRQVGERLQVEQNIDDGFSSKGPWTFTFETPEKYDHGTFKCVACNVVGTVESKPVYLYGKLCDDARRVTASLSMPRETEEKERLQREDKRMADNTSRYFISYSNKSEDCNPVTNVVIPKLKKKGIIIYEQNELQPGTHVLTAITSLVDKTDKTLLFISENSLDSSWCSFELLISLEKSQRTNRLTVVLLLHKIEESQLPHIAVLQEARKIHFDEQNDEWVREVVEGLRETKTIDDIMPAGNVAHGLVWGHYAEFLQYVLPELEKTVKESEWYKSLTEEVRKKVSCKLYELVPKTCAVKYNIPEEDDNIKNVVTFTSEVMRGGSYIVIFLKMYSITIGQETCYCVCEFPNVIGTMKVMEDNHLARFSQEGLTTAAQFTTEDKKLQLGRFYYTLKSTLNHFDDCKDSARVLLYNDEKKKISDVLMEAIKNDLKEESFQEKKFKEGNQPLQIDRLEPEEELQYDYQVYVAYTDHHEDKQKAKQIMDYLREKGIADSDILDADSFLPRSPWSYKLTADSCKCRWFIFLLTENALKDKSLNYNVIIALGDSIYRRKVRVIPVVDRCDHLFIPEALRWITYIPFDIYGRHLESLYSIVSGRDIPMETQMVLPAGDVAYGLAWGYVTNYLMKILPKVLKGISPAFEEKAVKNFRCPHKLFIVIPKSCSAGKLLNDKQNDPGRIENFSETAAVYPFGEDRAFHCNIYKVSPSSFNMKEGLYFVGQYAAPVTCLEEMKKWKIAGVNMETMASEAKRFYEIVGQLMKNAVPEKAQYCEFIYYDDMTHSLADIMEQKIQSMKDVPKVYWTC